MAYTVQFVRRPEPRWMPALFYGYLALVVPFAVWRVTIVNWHVWYGPLALVADLFAVTMFLVLLGHARWLYEPVHRPVDLSARVVDCLIPTHTEPVDIIEPTVLAALRVRGVRRVVVLANWERADVRAMAARLGVAYRPRNSNEHGKAGNLNQGLRHTDAEFVLTLDADHLARPEFLERTLGFFDDPSVAFVQTPQSFYNTESLLFRRGRGRRSRLWAESHLFYRCILLARNRWNASFYVGTSAVLRRSALEEVGGFATGTVTEDIHTALRLHARGWRSVYLPEPLAFGLEAQSFREYYAQRRRWAAGSLVLLFRLRDSPLRIRGLSLHQRLNYLESTMSHLSGVQRLLHLLLPALTLLTLTSPVSIPYGHYGLVFVAFFAVTFGMSLVYGRGAYHPLHSDAYGLGNIVAQAAALSSLVRRERRHSAARKLVPHAERSWAKVALWTLTLVVTATDGYGAWLIARGDHSGIVVASTFWNSVQAFWLWWLVAFLVRYERRRQAPQHERLRGLDKYGYVMRLSGAGDTHPVLTGAVQAAVQA